MTLQSAALVGFAAARDLDRARDFYAGVLGLELVEQSPFACVFDVNGTMLRVTQVEEVVPAPYTVLGWRVDDIVTRVRALTAAGVVFTRYDGLPQDDHGIWTAPGADRIAWFHDPDGNVLSLVEFAGP